MSPYNYEKTYEKWKKVVFKGNIYIVALSLAVGVGNYFLLQKNNLFTSNWIYYMFRYVLAPALFYIALLWGGAALMKLNYFAERRGDYIPIIQLSLICAGNAIANYEYPVVAGNLCFPIFVSIIFDNAKMTKVICAISYVELLCLYGQIRVAEYFRGVKNPNVTIDIFVLGSLILAAYITCLILNKFHAEKKQEMEEMHRYEIQLREELNKDPKTGLLNSSAFMNKLYRETEKSRFAGWPLMIVIMDVDDFKRINDSYGFAKGDKVLTETAETLKKYFPAKEFPARLSGEEFVAIVRKGTVVDLKERMESLNREFASQSYSYVEEKLTMSIGIAEWKKGMTDQQLFISAEKALRRAKELGKNRIVVWSDAYEKM